MSDVTPEVRLQAADDEALGEVLAAFDDTFGFTTSQEAHDRTRRHTEPERTVAARTADDHVVGTAGAYSFRMALPFHGETGCAGITRVSVRADHRRRGLLTRMMTWLLDDAERRGEPLAALWASEAPIYGRFGFGPAAPTVHVEVDRRHAALRTDGPLDEVALVDHDVAAAAFPAIYRRAAVSRPGTLSRSEAWWARVLADVESERGGAGPLRLALLPGRGYAIHRLRPSWAEGVPVGTVELDELVALDPAAHAALWRFVLDTDLAVRLQSTRRPVDDPLFAMLVDPVRARVTSAWPLQVRLVDVAAAFETRGYGAEGTCVLRVEDRFRPANTGTWRLTVSGGSGRCVRVGDAADPDLHLDTDVLATVYLGGVRATHLQAAGRIHGDPAAAASLDRLLATDTAPWHGGMF